MTIKIDPNLKTIRECTAPFRHTVDGELQTTEIRVQYYSLTIRELKKYRADLEAKIESDPETVIWLSETLAPRIHGLPDLTDADGKALPISIETLDTIALENLEAIRVAIDKDVAGKEQPSKSVAG